VFSKLIRENAEVLEVSMNVRAKSIARVFLAGLASGAVVWGLSVPLTGMREPFDSPGYYYVIAMIVAGFLAAMPAPRYWWVAVIGIFLGERIYAFVMLPETRHWLMASVILNLLVFSWLWAALGALSAYFARRWLQRRSRKYT
jgi:hypothetical protein